MLRFLGQKRPNGIVIPADSKICKVVQQSPVKSLDWPGHGVYFGDGNSILPAAGWAVDVQGDDERIAVKASGLPVRKHLPDVNGGGD